MKGAIDLEMFNEIVGKVNDFVWGPPMLVLIVTTGVYLTFRLKFLNVTRLGYALKQIFSKNKEGESGDISQYKSLMTALAATIGTGNIAGVATAITLGGPGALFWMIVTAFFGMSTKYAEGLLAVKYRTLDKRGEVAGGPMYYLERGLNLKWLAVLFAIFGSIAAFGIGNLVQSNSIADVMFTSFKIPTIATGIAMALLTALVILGGIKSISNITSLIVPFMGAFYVLTSLIIIGLNINHLPEAIGTIMKAAFTGADKVGAGFAGATVAGAIRFGVARGVFSNESGLGSAPIVAAAAKTDHPTRQGLVSMTGTFIDTVIICNITGILITITGVWQSASKSGLTGASLTAKAFTQSLGPIGGVLVAISIVLFAYSTILGWSYYGEKCIEYLGGENIIKPYRYLFILIVVVGAVARIEVVWNLADTFNGLMAIPNLVGLLLLSNVVIKETKDFMNTKYKEERLK